MLKYLLGFRENPSLVRTHAVQNPVLFLCLTDFSQQTAGSHAQYLESTSPTQNVGLHIGLCSADSVVFQIRNVRRFVTSESPLSLVSFYFRLFVLVFRAPVHSSFHLRRRMLLLVLGADPCLFTGPVYAVGFPALLQLVRRCFNILQGHLC